MLFIYSSKRGEFVFYFTVRVCRVKVQIIVRVKVIVRIKAVE